MEYRSDNKLEGDTSLDWRVVKTYFFKKLMRNRLRQLVSEKESLSDEQREDLEISDIELRFGQNTLGLSRNVAAIVQSPEKLHKYLQSQMHEDILMSQDEPQAPLIPTPIYSFEGLELHFGSYITVEPSKPNGHAHVNGKPETPRKIRFAYNDFQKALFEFGNATRTGNWEKAEDLYLKWLEYLPQYPEHRAAVMDMCERYLNSELPKFPQRVLSIASGPHEELRAMYDLRDYIGEKLPEVINLDLSESFLRKSRERMPDELKRFGLDIVGDMRDLPDNLESIDMIECSSFDNLEKEEDIKKMVAHAISMLPKDGVIRFMIEDGFSDEFVQALEANKVHVIVKNRHFRLSEVDRKSLREKFGEKYLKRLDQKMKRHTYFLATMSDVAEKSSLEDALNNTSVYAKRHYNLGGQETELQQAETEDVELSVMQAVALNPLFMLEKKGLSQSEVEFALERLSGHLDTVIAAKLYQQYFGIANVALQPFQAQVFRMLQSTSRCKDFLSLEMLNHENEEVKNIFTTHFINHFADYVIDFFLSDIPQEEKMAYLQRVQFDEQVLGRISHYFESVSFSELQDSRIVAIFDELPKTIKLDLPIQFRFYKDLKKYYFEKSKGDVNEDALSPSEIDKLLSLPVQTVLGDGEMLQFFIRYSTERNNVRTFA